MQFRSIFVSVFLLSLVQVPAFAENWVTVGPSPSHYTSHYDSASVGRDGVKAGLVSLTNYVSPQTSSDVAGGLRSYSSQTFFMVFDCSSRELVGLGKFMWFSNQWAGGELVFRADGFDTTRRPINAGTANEAQYLVACNR